MAKKVTDLTIKSWLNERFEGRACGNGLYLVYRKDMACPLWRFRYRLAGKQHQMFIGSYKDLSLAEATKEAKRLNALVALGHDVAKEKQDRKREGIARREAENNRITVAMLAGRYFNERVKPKLKEPKYVKCHLDRLIQALGRMNVEDVTGKDINAMYQNDLARGFPANTNKLREQALRCFGFGVALHIIDHNPAQWLDISYAGGQAKSRERNLSRDELTLLFDSMRACQSFGRENYLTVKLLLLLGVRKGELIGAKKSEFDLDGAAWHLPEDRTKTKASIIIPLPLQAIDALKALFYLSADSDYLLPARKGKGSHIAHATLNEAFKKLPIKDFTPHDTRRTAKSRLQELGVDEFISERCLNHKIEGIAGTYGRHDFFEERKHALQLWANYLESCEQATEWNVISINAKKAG